MKAKITTGIALTILSLTAYGQADIKSYFDYTLQGDRSPYTESQRLRWSDVEAHRAHVWQVWCEANHFFFF